MITDTDGTVYEIVSESPTETDASGEDEEMPKLIPLECVVEDEHDVIIVDDMSAARNTPDFKGIDLSSVKMAKSQIEMLLAIQGKKIPKIEKPARRKHSKGLEHGQIARNKMIREETYPNVDIYKEFSSGIFTLDVKKMDASLAKLDKRLWEHCVEKAVSYPWFTLQKVLQNLSMGLKTYENQIEVYDKIEEVFAKCYPLFGSNVERIDDEGYTMLHRAIYAKHWRLAKSLVELNTPLHIRIFNEESALEATIQMENFEFLKVLLGYGATYHYFITEKRSNEQALFMDNTPITDELLDVLKTHNAALEAIFEEYRVKNDQAHHQILEMFPVMTFPHGFVDEDFDRVDMVNEFLVKNAKKSNRDYGYVLAMIVARWNDETNSVEVVRNSGLRMQTGPILSSELAEFHANPGFWRVKPNKGLNNLVLKIERAAPKTFTMCQLIYCKFNRTADIAIEQDEELKFGPDQDADKIFRIVNITQNRIGFEAATRCDYFTLVPSSGVINSGGIYEVTVRYHAALVPQIETNKRFGFDSEENIMLKWANAPDGEDVYDEKWQKRDVGSRFMVIKNARMT
ncbi:unnamed protein product [Caenorhabditis sp. 36 PRJEB53466]|nr:unnamed protein product [Caenorhabditis sp. 36 PRJEB53466]